MARLLEMQEKGLYCSRGNFFIDPLGKVENAIITHAHMDHARKGSQNYFATPRTVEMMKYRLGSASYHTIPFHNQIEFNGVVVSFHPAGHLPGSAQIRVEYDGEVWVVSGDYKIENDGVSEEFEVVKCDVFITECTFGLPVFNWKPQEAIAIEINNWWRSVAAEKGASIIGAYSLGKAQRVLNLLDTSIGPIYQHNAVYQSSEILKKMGIHIPETQLLSAETQNSELEGSAIIVPPVALDSRRLRKIKNRQTAMVSGWMHVRGTRRRRNVDRGFVLSDHADWDGLLYAIKSSGAQEIYVTHGYTDIMKRYLDELGYITHVL